MRPRILAAAFSAAFSASLAAASDPLPLPPVGTPSKAVPAPAIPAIPVPGTTAVPPATLPPVKPRENVIQEKGDNPKPLPIAPKPSEPMPKKGSDAPLPMAESHNEMPAMSCEKDRSIHDDHLGPWNTVWVRGGYNYLWIKQAPASVPLLASNGTILAGNTTTNFGGFSGISVDGGLWLNERHTLGIGAGGFLAEKRSNVTAFSSDAAGNPDARRPFFNAAIAGQNAADSFIVSAPGQFTGSFAYEQGARVAGFDVYGIMNVANNEKWTVNYTLGFRYFDLDEYATTYQATQSVNGAATIPFFGQAGGVNAVGITDRIRTRNQLYGGQIGGDVEYRLGPVYFDANVKAALGPNHQITEVSGRTDSVAGSGPGGFLAVGNFPNGNQGRLSNNNFAVLADVNTMVGVQVSSHFRVGFGYQFIYLNNVVRPSAQFVTGIDPRLVPTSSTYGAIIPSNTALGGLGTPPNTPVDRGDFFLHGLKFMLEAQY